MTVKYMQPPNPLTPAVVQQCRDQFPALTRAINGRPAVYLDGPAGSQTPQRVIDAIVRYLSHYNANHEGLFATSRESDHMLECAHAAAAAFVGTDDPDTIVFGANMTTLTFALSRSLSKSWSPGDEILVTRLDHDANVTPWVMAARDAGVTVRYADFHHQNCTLNLDDLRAKLSAKTRLVAVGCASNSVGTINPVRDITRWAHECGALVFLDAVHWAPHALIDVKHFDCDFLACSAYKFFGPHVGILWGRRQWLESLEAYKVRPASDQIPGKWMTGTQNHEGIAGTLEAIHYLADLGRNAMADTSLELRPALTAAYQVIGQYERTLTHRLLSGLASIPEIKIWGITDPARAAERFPTVSITHANMSPARIAKALDNEGIFVWNGHYYALQLTETLGLEPDGMVRIGLLHYNTPGEIDRLLDALKVIQ